MNNKGNLTDERPPLLPVIIGTGFGSGFWPWGPGTAGSVLATLIWGISWMLNSGGTIALTEFLNAHEHIQLHYMIPKSIVSLLVAIFVNYPGQKKFVFKQ